MSEDLEFRLLERARCHERLARAVVEAYASPALTRAISNYTAERIVDELRSNHGCKVIDIPVGHNPPERSEDPA